MAADAQEELLQNEADAIDHYNQATWAWSRGQPPSPTVRDNLTGEVLLQQLVEEARQEEIQFMEIGEAGKM